MKKFYLSFIGALALLCTLDASAAYKSVVLSRHDGSTMKVAIEDDMNASLSDGNLVLTCAKGDISVPTSELNKWTFSTEDGDADVWSAIDAVETDAATIVRRDGELSVRGLAQGERIVLASVDGRVITAATASEGVDFNIDLNSLVPGIYVLAYGNHSLKIALR